MGLTDEIIQSFKHTIQGLGSSNQAREILI